MINPLPIMVLVVGSAGLCAAWLAMSAAKAGWDVVARVFCGFLGAGFYFAMLWLCFGGPLHSSLKELIEAFPDLVVIGVNIILLGAVFAAGLGIRATAKNARP